MDNFFGIGRRLLFIPIVTLLGVMIFLSCYGTWIFIKVVYLTFSDASVSVNYTVGTILSVMDIYLLAIISYIFSAGIYELFIAPLDLPQWLKISHINELKSKLSSVVILFLAITFTKQLITWTNAVDTLLFALATACIMAVLIVYYRLKDEH